jgi:phasin family protein
VQHKSKFGSGGRTGPRQQHRQVRERHSVMQTFEDMQKLGRDNMDATMQSFGALSKSFQAIAVEMADYSKKAFEDGAAATEKLLGAKSLEKAIEVQSDYFKSAYEGFVSETTRLGELFADLAQEAYKPFEGYMAKAGVAK